MSSCSTRSRWYNSAQCWEVSELKVSYYPGCTLRTERLEEYYHTPVDQISPTKEDEIDWGKPQGNEIW